LPQAADDIEALVGLATARLRVHAEHLPFGRQWAANAESRQQAAVGQHVDGSALLGQQHGVAERQRHDVHAKPHTPRASGQGRHRGHRFKERLMANDPVGLPDRIHTSGLTHVDPAPVRRRAGKRKLRTAQSDPDTHAPSFLPP